ncbi:hypothetical protein GCM10010129_84610 [Streptomyces fumigatiscleroticus]|nr:hypothetical protein GCM10010129_84610 [Streptomyces fumigatiscleroticus]
MSLNNNNKNKKRSYNSRQKKRRAIITKRIINSFENINNMVEKIN